MPETADGTHAHAAAFVPGTQIIERLLGAVRYKSVKSSVEGVVNSAVRALARWFLLAKDFGALGEHCCGSARWRTQNRNARAPSLLAEISALRPRTGGRAGISAAAAGGLSADSP
jgi:hypothetical protein